MKVVILAILAGVGLAYAFPAVRVCGNSMYPTYHDGEWFRGFRFFPKSKLKPGDVIVLKSPDGTVVVKRLRYISGAKHNRYFYILGDNAEESYDSREYGTIHQSKFVCRLMCQRQKKGV